MPDLLFQLGKLVHITQICIKSHLEFKRNRNLVNIVGTTLPTFYIFKGSRMQEDYIRDYRLGTCMAMQKKTWMTTYLFKQWLAFFYRSIPRGGFLRELTSLDSGWAWFSCYNMNIGTNSKS
jgi:hypothetical protein